MYEAHLTAFFDASSLRLCHEMTSCVPMGVFRAFAMRSS